MKFRVTRDTDYVMGHLRYGHAEGIVEVESEEELRKLIESDAIYDYLDLVVDSYSVEDVCYGDYPVKYTVMNQDDNELNWYDLGDAYMCPVCRKEVNNPAKFKGCKCPNCGFQSKRDKGYKND